MICDAVGSSRARRRRRHLPGWLAGPVAADLQRRRRRGPARRRRGPRGCSAPAGADRCCPPLASTGTPPRAALPPDTRTPTSPAAARPDPPAHEPDLRRRSHAQGNPGARSASTSTRSAGWLGSYGGEDSPDDISRGLFAGEVGAPGCSTCSAPRHEDDLVRPGPLDRDVPRPDRRRSSTPATRSACTGTRHENPIAMSREQETAVLDRCIDLIEERLRAASHRLRRAVVGVPPVTNELLLERGHQVRPLVDAQRLPALLRPGRRQWTKIDYTQAGRGLDEAAGARAGDRPRRDPGELVPRRPAADDVHQDQPEQPRLRQPAPPRGDVARPVRLGLPRDGLRRVDHHDPPGRLRAAAGAAMLERLIEHINATRASAGRPSTRSRTTSHVARAGG